MEEEEEEVKWIEQICLVGCCTIIVVVLGDSLFQTLPTINCILKLFNDYIISFYIQILV